jgi:hypothetical protein
MPRPDGTHDENLTVNEFHPIGRRQYSRLRHTQIGIAIEALASDVGRHRKHSQNTAGPLPCEALEPIETQHHKSRKNRNSLQSFCHFDGVVVLGSCEMIPTTFDPAMGKPNCWWKALENLDKLATPTDN